jgi:hypothetical protein
LARIDIQPSTEVSTSLSLKFWVYGFGVARPAAKSEFIARE